MAGPFTGCSRAVSGRKSEQHESSLTGPRRNQILAGDHAGHRLGQRRAFINDDGRVLALLQTAGAGPRGAKVKQSYHPPATPCDRLLAHAGVEETVKTTLRTQRDPVELLHRIRQGQAELAALSTGEPSEGPRWFIHGHPHVD